MEKSNQNHNREFETLYRKIFETIIQSPEVKNELLVLMKKGKLSSKTVFVLVTKMEELLQAIVQGEADSVEKKEKALAAKKSVNPRLLTGKKGQFIDGRELSQAELEFEEYCRRNFNEEQWLKEVGINYP